MLLWAFHSWHVSPTQSMVWETNPSPNPATPKADSSDYFIEQDYIISFFLWEWFDQHY
jgi:hypothetical protein